MPNSSIKEILSKVLDLGDTPIHNAIISLIFTSGLKEKSFRDFKIKKLIEACNYFFDDDEPRDIDSLLNKNPDEIFCCWEVKDESKYQVTFSTPEATRYIFNYLKQIGNIRDEDYLFQVKNNGEFRRIRDGYVADMINNKQNTYNDRFGGRDNNIHLTSTIIISNFINVCNEHLDLDDKSELIDLFRGNATEDNTFYQMFKEDKMTIFNYYKQICPYLVINNVSSIGSSNESTTSLTAQSLMKQTSNQHNSPNTTEGAYQAKIKKYFDNTFKFKYMEGFSRQNNIKLLGYAFGIARTDIEKDKYEESDDYYDNLLKKATFYVLYRKNIDNLSDKLDFDEVSPTEPQERLDMVCNFIKNMGIDDFNLSDEELQDIVGYHFALHGNVMGEFNEGIFEKILLSSIFEIMKTNGMIQYIF